MHSIAQTTTTSSPLPEQSKVASLTAELMIDAEDGQLNLLASTLGNAADLQVISPTGLLEMVANQRKQLDQIEALAQEYAEKVAIPALLTKYGFELEELDVASLFEGHPKLATGFGAFAAVHDDGRSIVVVPAGQAPIVRLAAIRDLILYMEEQA
ncbi:hypothetical protein CJD44_14410 [Streptomyces sp. alain-838]|nr:hypothetical protein [Streptomyces sp. alain-838]PAK25815.1 hypothetical protein CJD44_14410 [Streptomyces sp. alain-838]